MRQSAEYLIRTNHFAVVAPQMPGYFRTKEALNRCLQMMKLAGYDETSFGVDEELVPYKN